jgi:long-subunit acyl-CoA synthetase (AMP-forming)
MSIINNLISRLENNNEKLVTFHKRKRIEISFDSLYNLVLKASYYLNNMGVSSGTVVTIIGENNLGFIIADLACIHIGAKILPMDLNSDLKSYQSSELQMRVILLADEYENRVQKDLNLDYILISEITSSQILSKKPPHKYLSKEVISYKSTSGSTGFPKIIGASVEGVENSIQCVQEIFKHSKKDNLLVFLPLNLLQQRYWLYSAILFDFNIVVVPKEYVFMAIKQESPTVIMGVPYIYEIIASDYKKSIIKDEHLEAKYKNYIKETSPTKHFKPFMEYLGGSIRYLWTGSAPISMDVLEFYSQMGIPLYQGYGMNETCIISKNYPDNNKIGSVGKLFPNIKIKFDDQNQILIKNKYPVCQNYTIAVLEDSQQFFLNNGYVATGDTGYLDQEGYLFIDGRKKEMIALSNSKKIFPRSLENKIMESEEIENCVFFGDNKPYLTALIVTITDKISYENVEVIISNYNQQVSLEEKVYKFFLTNEKFSEENELLTNQHKIKRKKILEKYKKQFESLYKS